jgi:hypothetical protein
MYIIKHVKIQYTVQAQNNFSSAPHQTSHRPLSSGNFLVAGGLHIILRSLLHLKMLLFEGNWIILSETY